MGLLGAQHIGLSCRCEGVRKICGQPEAAPSSIEVGAPALHISTAASGSDRTHAARRGQILLAHPEVRQLFGRDPSTFLITAAIFFAQFGLAALFGWLGLAYWPLALLTAVLFGAFANHANYVIIHDAIHNLVFESRSANRLTAILADLPNGIPTAMGFRVYHLKHHSHLSTYDHDADVPSKWEVRLVGNSAWRKAAWLFLFPVAQLLRVGRLKGPVPFWRPWLFANIAAVAVLDALLVYAFGINALVYLLFSFWFSVGGLHPLSARWLQEHFSFGPDQGTFNYYGPLNKLALNIGYHNEHHDFPDIPWSRLPLLTQTAPEYYRTLASQSSWSGLLVSFISNPAYSLATRTANMDQKRANR